MNKPRTAYSVSECKIQASILLKSVRSSDLKKSLASAKRFQILPEFKSLPCEEIITLNLKRKFALNVIALEKGFDSWNTLNCH